MQTLNDKRSTIGEYRRSITEILEDFSKPIPDRLIEQKPTFSKGQRRGEVDYVPWHTLVKLLNFYVPGWEWEIRSQSMGDRVVVEGRLTIHAAEGNFTREATGQELTECEGYGDPTSNAEAMALRRCCAKFGLGLHLWEK